SAGPRVVTSPEAHHSEAGNGGYRLWIVRQGWLVLADRGGVFAVAGEERSILVMRLGVPRIERHGSLDGVSCLLRCAGIAVAEEERARHPGVRRRGVLVQRAIGGGQAAGQDAVGGHVFGERSPIERLCMSIGDARERSREARVEPQRSAVLVYRPVGGARSALREVVIASDEVVVGLGAPRRASCERRPLSRQQSARDDTGHGACGALLELEQVSLGAVVLLAPETHAGGGSDEFHGDAQ